MAAWGVVNGQAEQRRSLSSLACGGPPGPG